MKRNSTSGSKSKNRSVSRTPSPGLVDYIHNKFSKKLPPTAITAIHKVFGKSKPLNKDDGMVKRFTQSDSNINTNKIVEYLKSQQYHEKGKALSDEAIDRIFEGKGKMSFIDLIKMGENCGMQFSEKTAKAVLRKYGKRKDHINADDVKRINEKRKRGPSKSTSKGKY